MVPMPIIFFKIKKENNKKKKGLYKEMAARNFRNDRCFDPYLIVPMVPGTLFLHTGG